jgi:hypothetical protein
MYYSALNATCYNVACPLVVKDLSITLTNNAQLAFPIPEYIYLNMNNNDITVILPYVNQSIGNVNVLTQSFRFKIRMMQYTQGRYWYLQTYNETTPPGAVGGDIYNDQYGKVNDGSNRYRTDGIFYMEIHYYLGNWYFNRLS